VGDAADVKRAALLLLFACAHWSAQDTILQTTVTVASMGDWTQSQNIVDACEETNPVIGACGQRLNVNLYFALFIVAHGAISAILPPRWRTIWQALFVGSELHTVYRNAVDGYGLDGSSPPRAVIFRHF
jgi:hypothetical protein